MGKSYSDTKIPFIKEGILRDAEISHTVTTADCVDLAVNFYFDSLGGPTTRPGITKYGDVPSANPIRAFGSFAQNASTNRRLLIQIGTVVYSNNAGTSTSVRTGLSGTTKARFTQYTNLTYMVNGNSVAGGAAIQTFNGTTFSATNVGDLPPGDYIETFGGRIWVADNSTDRVYYTEIVSPTGVITGGLDYLSKLSPQDGESVTALKTIPQALLVFKQNQIFRVYSPDNVDPYPAYNVGTYSQESLIQTKSGLYFHHSSGFYKLESYNTKPLEISRRISDVVAAISRSNYESIFGWVSKDGNNIYWHVGDLVLEGITYANAVLRYTISTELWSICSYRKVLTAAITFDSGTIVAPFVGTSLGVTAYHDVGTTDLDEPIFFELESHWLALTETFSKAKKLTEVAAYHENMSGANMNYKIDNDTRNKWSSLGALSDTVITHLIPKENREFNRIKWNVKGQNSGDPARFYGIEIMKIVDEGYNDTVGN